MKKKRTEVPFPGKKRMTGSDLAFYFFLKSHTDKNDILKLTSEDIRKSFNMSKTALNTRLRKFKRLGLVVVTIQIENHKGKIVPFTNLPDAQAYMKEHGGYFVPSRMQVFPNVEGAGK